MNLLNKDMLYRRIGRAISVLLMSTGCSVEKSPPAQPTPLSDTSMVVADSNPGTDATAADDESLSTGCSRALPAPLPGPDRAALVPASDSNAQIDWRALADSIERVAFRTAEGKVSRAGPELRIQLLDGRTAVVKDDTTPGLRFAVPRYAGYLTAICSHVLHILQYEGSGAYLVLDDSTGDSTIVFGMPIVSPDAKRFVFTSRAGEANYNSSLIEVWRMVGRKPSKEFSFESESWEPSDAVWRDSAAIDFLENTHSSPGDPYIQTPARLARTGRTWVLFASPPDA